MHDTGSGGGGGGAAQLAQFDLTDLRQRAAHDIREGYDCEHGAHTFTYYKLVSAGGGIGSMHERSTGRGGAGCVGARCARRPVEGCGGRRASGTRATALERSIIGACDGPRGRAADAEPGGDDGPPDDGGGGHRGGGAAATSASAAVLGVVGFLMCVRSLDAIYERRKRGDDGQRRGHGMERTLSGGGVGRGDGAAECEGRGPRPRWRAVAVAAMKIRRARHPTQRRSGAVWRRLELDVLMVHRAVAEGVDEAHRQASGGTSKANDRAPRRSGTGGQRGGGRPRIRRHKGGGVERRGGGANARSAEKAIDNRGADGVTEAAPRDGRCDAEQCAGLADAAAVGQVHSHGDPSWRTGLPCRDPPTVGASADAGPTARHGDGGVYGGRRLVVGAPTPGAAVGQMHSHGDAPSRARLPWWEPPTVGATWGDDGLWRTAGKTKLTRRGDAHGRLCCGDAPSCGAAYEDDSVHGKGYIDTAVQQTAATAGALTGGAAVGQIQPHVEPSSRTGLPWRDSPTVGAASGAGVDRWTKSDVCARMGATRDDDALGAGDGAVADEGRLNTTVRIGCAYWEHRGDGPRRIGGAHGHEADDIEGHVTTLRDDDEGGDRRGDVARPGRASPPRGRWRRGPSEATRPRTDGALRNMTADELDADCSATCSTTLSLVNAPHTPWQRRQRLGEADNPGPAAPQEEWRPWRRLTRTALEGAAAVEYPQPGRPGFRDFVAPGFTRGARCPADGEFQLKVESANTTGWAALKRRLRATEAHALLAQETWVTQSMMPAASAWARRRGWKSVWAPAAKGPGGGPSAGVAIFVRDCMGLKFPPVADHVWWPARAVSAVMEAPGFRPVLLTSLYLISGGGTGRANLEILAEVGDRMKRQGEGWLSIMGGDFNVTPRDITDVGFDRQTGSSVMYPMTERGTYRTSGTSSMIDFFLISDQLAAAVEDVQVVEAAGTKPHVPVAVRFKARAAAIRALHLRKPPELAFERVVGPIPPPPCWERPRTDAEAALDAARRGSPDAATKLEEAYRSWANAAETELEQYAGRNVKKKGLRGEAPRLVWRSVMPERPPTYVFPRAAATSWLRSTVIELQRIGASAKAAMTRAAGDDSDDDDDDGPPGLVPDSDSEDEEDDGDIELDGDGDDVARGDGRQRATAAARAQPSTVDQCRSLLAEIMGSLKDDVPAGEPPAEIAALHQKVTDVTRRIDEAMKLGDDTARHDAGARGRGAPHRRADEWAHIGGDTIRRCEEEVRALRDVLDESLKEMEGEARNEESKAWREWVQEGVDAGAARAHAYTRTPEAWTPTVVPDSGTAFTCSPEVLLDGQRDKYRRLWRPAAGPYRYDWESREELPMLEPWELRESSKSFKRSTAMTFDGFHPRQLAHLCDAALAVLALILQAVEVGGAWPRQLALVVTPLLPKPKGGFRPIGLMPAAYRVWAKARRRWADEWEQRNARPYLSAARGNGSLDTMWRLAARQEEGAAEGAQAAVAAEDIQSFFEVVDRARLVEEARALDFPMPLIKAALAAYGSARMLTMQGRVAREVYPTSGVVAGCPLATALVKVFYLRALDQFVAATPEEVHLDAYVDDLTLSTIGTAQQVVLNITHAHERLRHTVVEVLGCAFAEGKTSIVATTKAAAAAIARNIGVEDSAAQAQCLLGVDNAAGGTRRRLRRGSRKASRLRAALARRRRLAALKGAIGSRKANKVFRAGLQPAAAYCSPIWGVDDDEVLQLRRLAAAAMTPKARGRSLEMTHLWYGTPTAAAEAAPVAQYARMVWIAVTKRDQARLRGAALTDIRRMWEAAHRQFGPLVERWAAARGENGEVPRRVARRLWGSVGGPIAAAALSLARVGWEFADPFTLRSDRGAEVVLTQSSPAMIKGLMTDAVRRTLERKAAVRIAREDPRFRGRRVCADLVIRAARPRSGVTPVQCGALKSVACGALMTRDKARRLGYDTDGLCPLCQAAPDRPRHRVYGCSHSEDAVKAAVPSWFWHEAQRASPSDAFWWTGLIPHPADIAPDPHHSLHMQVEVRQDVEMEDDAAAARAAEHGCDLRAGVDPRGPHQKAELGGLVYMDGSCRPSPVRDMARAGCAILEVTKDGRMVRSLEATVPWHLPQTAQAAEFLGMALGYRYVRRLATFVGDCLGAVRAMSGPSTKALAATARYAGIVMDTLRDPAQRRLVQQVRWTKAHRHQSAAVDSEDLRDINANAMVDELAKSAARLHPPLGEEIEESIAFHEKRVQHVVAAVAAAMQVFPPAPKGDKRTPRPADAAQAKERRVHLWRFRAGAWRCQLCNDWLNLGASTPPPYRYRQRCRGRAIDEDAHVMAKNGHRLCRAEGGLPFVICTACGAWGNRRTRRLAGPCGAPTAAGIQAVKRVEAGWHPMLRKGADGRDLPRDRVAVTHHYDAEAKKWRSLDPAACGRPTDHGGTNAASISHHHLHHPPVLDARDNIGDAGPGDEGDGGAADLPPWWADVPVPRDLSDDEMGGEEQDVFGHGGSLDRDPQPKAGGWGSGAAGSGHGRVEDEEVTMADASAGGGVHGRDGPDTAAEEMPRVPTPSVRRSMAAKREGEPIDYAARAIARIMADSRPAAGDAAVRMGNLRRRIRERLANADAAASPTPAAPAGPSNGGADDDAPRRRDLQAVGNDKSGAAAVATEEHCLVNTRRELLQRLATHGAQEARQRGQGCDAHADRKRKMCASTLAEAEAAHRATAHGHRGLRVAAHGGHRARQSPRRQRRGSPEDLLQRPLRLDVQPCAQGHGDRHGQKRLSLEGLGEERGGDRRRLRPHGSTALSTGPHGAVGGVTVGNGGSCSSGRRGDGEGSGGIGIGGGGSPAAAPSTCATRGSGPLPARGGSGGSKRPPSRPTSAGCLRRRRGKSSCSHGAGDNRGDDQRGGATPERGEGDDLGSPQAKSTSATPAAHADLGEDEGGPRGAASHLQHGDVGAVGAVGMPQHGKAMASTAPDRDAAPASTAIDADRSLVITGREPCGDPHPREDMLDVGREARGITGHCSGETRGATIVCDMIPHEGNLAACGASSGTDTRKRRYSEAAEDTYIVAQAKVRLADITTAVRPSGATDKGSEHEHRVHDDGCHLDDLHLSAVYSAAAAPGTAASDAPVGSGATVACLTGRSYARRRIVGKQSCVHRFTCDDAPPATSSRATLDDASEPSNRAPATPTRSSSPTAARRGAAVGRPPERPP